MFGRRVRGGARWLAGALLLLGGCAHTGVAPCETPPPFFLTLRGEERLNQDALGRSLPTLVRVLQLKSTARLEELDATELWQQGEERLAADLVASEELTVSPGEAQERWVSRSPEARVLVIAGLFRQPSGTSWRSLQVLPGVPADLCRTGARAPTEPPGGRDVRLAFVLEDFAIRAETVRSSSAGR